MLFIRNRRYSLEFLSGFTRGEYHIVCVDFIVALRRTKGRRRRTLRSPSPPSSGLHLLTPGNPLRRACRLPRAWGNLGSCIPVLSLLPSSEFGLAICVRAGIVRVSVGLFGFGHSFFIIGGRGCSCLRLRGVWLWSIVGFALTANGSAIWRMKGRGTESYRSILNMV